MGSPLNPPEWAADLDERQLKEVLLARDYAKHYAHGTTGHMQLMLIDKLSSKLDDYEGMLIRGKTSTIAAMNWDGPGKVPNGTSLAELFPILDTRVFNALRRSGIYTVEQVEGMSDAELGKLRNMGVSALRRARRAVEDYRARVPRSVPSTEPADLVEHVPMPLAIKLAHLYDKIDNLEHSLRDSLANEQLFKTELRDSRANEERLRKIIERLEGNSDGG